MGERIVSVPKGSFAFCRLGVMVLVWLAFIFKINWLVILVFVILGLSALFTVKYAPMILIYSLTVNKLFKSKDVVLNVKAMRFAHTMGTILSGIIVLVLYFGSEYVGWVILGFFAVLKTISAFGFCPGEKLYTCMKKGGCCSFSKKISKASKK